MVVKEEMKMIKKLGAILFTLVSLILAGGANLKWW